MDSTHRSWGTDKGEDREYAKALRDHAASGSTVPLVGVEYGVEVTGNTLTLRQCVVVHDAFVDMFNDKFMFEDPPTNAVLGAEYCNNAALVSSIYNFLKQRGNL